MVPVSQAWKNAQREILVPESFVEIRIEVGNPDAQRDAVVSVNGAEFFCEPQEIVQDIADPVPYAMLEPGLWILDGTRRILGGPIGPPQSDHTEFVPLGEEEPLLVRGGEPFHVFREVD